MEIEVIGGYGGESDVCRLTCLLINGSVALDAGSLSRALPVERQLGVGAILLTHSHIDHTNSLPCFIENIYQRGRATIDIYASGPTIYAVRKHLFNNASWPDFSRMPNNLLPAIRFRELSAEVPVFVEGVKFTPVPVDHLVPTFGYLIEQGGAAVLWSSDTGPTTRLWEIANQTPNLAAVCIDTSFDNSMQEIADLSLHLTPRTLGLELEKLERDVRVIVHHIKPPCIDRVREEVTALGDPRIEFLEQGRSYEF